MMSAAVAGLLVPSDALLHHARDVTRTTAIRDPLADADNHPYEGPPGRPSLVSCWLPDPSGAARQTFGPQRYSSASTCAGVAAASGRTPATIAAAERSRQVAMLGVGAQMLPPICGLCAASAAAEWRWGSNLPDECRGHGVDATTSGERGEMPAGWASVGS